VLVYGGDLFHTSIAPSEGFDLLSESFQYSNLLLTIVGLAAVTVFTSYRAKAKELALAFK
jgi:hypothetical protein